MKPYSKDLRQKIIETKLQTQESDAKIALQFKVSRSFVNKLVRQFKQKGSVEVLPHAGGASMKLTIKEIELLKELIREDPNLTLKQIQQSLTKIADVTVSLATLSRLLKKLKINTID
jgi:transposase